jgi:hypothetical protein
MIRVLLYQNNVPQIYWSDIVLTSAYLINQLPSANLNYKIPLEIIYQTKIIIDHLKIFGCTCYIYNDNKQDKFDFRVIKYIFLGYSTQKRGYKCYDLINKYFYNSKNIKF